ncbi:DNA alkylation repair protein, partial [Aeromonas caviae]|nr:DNA alkylation repair protein [Aeromonas caviae]
MTRSRITDIAPSRLAQLNRGEAEASNLTECLAVDFAALMQCTLPSLGPQALASMHAASGEGITRRMALAARLLLAENGTRGLAALSRHPSDTVRGWACFMVGASEGLSLSDRLALIRPLADDPHFGVREWAWLAMRSTIAAQLEVAIAALEPWTA